MITSRELNHEHTAYYIHISVATARAELVADAEIDVEVNF